MNLKINIVDLILLSLFYSIYEYASKKCNSF